MSDKVILSAYQKSADVDIDSWLMAEGETPKEPKPGEKSGEQPAQKKDEGGFFNSVGGWIRKQTGAEGTGPLAAAGRAAAAVPERFSEGMTQMGEARRGKTAEGQDFQPLDVELPGVGKVQVPSGVMRAAHGAIGALGTVFPFGAAAKSAGGDIASAAGAENYSDEGIKAQLDQLRALPPVDVNIAGPDAATGIQTQIQRLERLLMMPTDQRMKLLETEAGSAAEMGSAAIPGYGLVAGFLKRGAGVAKAAEDAAKAARAEAVGRAAERAAAESAPKSAEEVAATMKGQNIRGRTPAAAVDADTKATIEAANKRGRVPGADDKLNIPDKPQLALPEYAGPTREGGAIVAGESTVGPAGRLAAQLREAGGLPLQKLPPEQRLRVLLADDEGRKAIEETFAQYAPKPEAPRGAQEPGRARAEGLTERERLRQEGRTGLEAEPRTPELEAAQAAAGADEARRQASGAVEPWPGTISGASDLKLVEDVRFKGEKPHELQHGENMVVATRNGEDVGYLWYTRVGGEGSGAGYTVRKVFVDPSARRQGVASELYKQVAKFEGPRLGSTDKTPEGAAFTAALEKRDPSIFGKGVAPKELADDVLDLMQGDADVAEAALRRYGYRSTDYGIKELPELHAALNLGKEPSGAAKTFAQDAALALSHDLGVAPSVTSDLVPAMAQVVKGIPEGELKTVRQIVEMGMKDPESPLSALRAMQFGGAGQEGKISAGTLFVIGRAALGAVAGSMTGDDPETSARNALLAAGFSAFLSPRLAKAIVANTMDPAVRDGLKKVLTLQGQEGALNLRFPGRKVGSSPSPNTERMGASNEAKRLVRGINEKLEKAGELSRSGVKTHEQTIQDALTSPYRTVEAVMNLDTAKLSLEELDGALTAARGVRDFVLEDVIQTAARAKLSGDAALKKEVVDKFLLSGKVSQRVTDFQTAVARAQGAGKIKSDAAIASKLNLDELDGEINSLRDALLSRGKVSDDQLVEMLTGLADAAATRQLANAASKWPEALWSIYYGLNLLGSPITQFRNMLGNAGALGMAVVDRGLGEIISLPFHAAGKGKNMVQPGETYEMVSGVVSTIMDSFRGGKDVKGAFGYGKDAFKSGESIFGMGKETDAIRTLEAAGDAQLPRVIQTMAWLGNANIRFMGGTDEFFKVLSFQGELRSLALRQARSSGKRGDDLVKEVARLVDEPEQALLAQATAFAKENTFTKAFTPGVEGGWRTAFGAGAALEGAANNPLMKVAVTPFFRTPVRIGEFATVHTPGLNLLATQFWSDMAAGGAKANLAAAKIATGSAVMLSVYWFASHGYITGTAPADPKLRESYMAAGWQEKSIYNPVTGKYYSYDNLEPLSTLIATAATVTQMGRDLPEQTAGDLFTAGVIAAAKNSLSKQWFSGISDFLDAVESGVRGEDTGAMVKLVGRRMSALIPGAAIQRQFNKMTDSEKRELKTVVDNENPELREFSSFMNIIKANVAGWGKNRPAMVNMITGEPVAAENTWLQSFNPFAVSTYKNDPVLNELVALEGAGLPREIPRVLGGSQPASPFKLPGTEEKAIREGVILSDVERQRLGVLLTKEEDHNGNTLHQALKDLMETDEYQDASDGRYGGKSSMIAETFNGFLEQAETALREEYPKLDQVISRRQLERGLGKLPKSMEDLKEPMRELVR